MTTGYKVGRQIRVYVDEAGAGVGTYEELLINKTPSFSSNWDDAVVEDHTNNFKRSIKGMCDLGIDLEVNMNTSSAQYKALRDAHNNADTGQIGLALVTGEITDVGEHMIEADWEVLTWEESNAIGDTVTVSMTVKPAANTSFTPLFSEIAV